MRGTATGMSGVDGAALGRSDHRRTGRVHPTAVLAVGMAACALALSACSLHVTKNGISGNIAGHSFAAEKGALPPGFPSAVPTPSGSTVLVGGMAGDTTGSGYTASFAVNGSLSSATNAYEAKFKAAGFNVSVTQVPGTSPSIGGTSTTDMSAELFTATDSQWSVAVVPATTSSVGEGLKAGQVAINIVVTSASLSTPTS